jgi:predicted nucleic acid-binding Zn ribbon protein
MAPERGGLMPFHNVHGVYPARKCIVCGKTFIPKTANHKVCSPECSKKRASELKPQYRAKTKKTSSVSNMDEIREIAKRGVHYGQYVAEAEGRINGKTD